MLLKELSEAVGVSGNEDAVRRLILQAIDGHASDIRIDPLGSVTAVKTGTGDNPLRVMVTAHMDEIGFIVRGYDSDGLIRFARVGGVDERILPGLRVQIGTKALLGVIIWTPIHMNRDQDTVSIDKLRIDIGVTSKDAAKKKVKIGDFIAFESRYMEIGTAMLRGRAFDNRAGCSLLVDLLQDDPYPVDILAAFTVQEEIGLRGAQVAGQTLDPDIVIALEGTTANDVPDPTADPDDQIEHNPVARLGAGPVLTIMDRQLIVNPRLLAFLRATAEANDIPYQFKTMASGATDAGAIHIANAGIPAAVISVACRYVHEPAAYMNRHDYDHALQLLKAVVNDLTPDVLSHE